MSRTGYRVLAGATVVEKLLTKAVGDVETHCWIWQGALSNKGYGQICTDRTRSAHRVSYETFVGPVPLGMQLDHLCRNRACINPGHLEPVTAKENQQRGWIARSSRLYAPTLRDFFLPAEPPLQLTFPVEAAA